MEKQIIHIPVHPLCNNQLVAREDEQPIGSEKIGIGSEENGIGSEKSSEENAGSSEEIGASSEKSSERPQDMFQVILDAIRKDAKVTAAEIAMHLA